MDGGLQYCIGRTDQSQALKKKKAKKCKKAKWLSEEALKIVEEREAKVKGERER